MVRILMLCIFALGLGSSSTLHADSGISNPPPPQPIGPPTPRPPEDEDEAMPQPPAHPPVPHPTPHPTPPPVGPTPYADTYGAIAYSYSSERFGTSSRHRDSYSAEMSARRNCGAYDCDFVHWFVNSCMALSRSYNGGVYFALGRTPQEAQSNSFWSCQQTYGNCRLVTSACSQ